MKYCNVIAAAAFAVLLAGARAGIAQDRPGVEAFFQNPRVVSVRMSPSGKHIGAIMREPNGRAALLVLNAANPGEAKLAAGFSNADVRSFEWVNDNRLYFITENRLKDSVGDPSFNTLAVNRDGSEQVQLMSSNWDYEQQTSFSHLKTKMLPADYRLFSVLHDGSDDVIVWQAKWTSTDYSIDQLVLYRLDTKSRQLTRLIAPDEPAPPRAITGWMLDRDGKPSIAIHSKRGRYVIFYREPETANWVQLGDFDALKSEGFRPAFMGFDNTLYVTLQTRDNAAALYRYDLKNRKLADEPVMTLKDFDFSGRPELDYQARKLVGIHYTTDADGTAWLDARFRELQKKIDAAIPGAVNTLTCGNCLSSERVLVTSQSDRQPLRYFVFDPAASKLIALGSRLPNIKPAQMGAREFYRFPARDGLQIPVYVTLPPGGAKGPYPAVVLVHGGPWVRGSQWEWDTEAQFLATRGYAVLQPEFRGSTGFGFRHFNAGRRQWGQAMQDDLADTAKWAIKQGIADPKRIAIGGASYGGYATLMGLARNPEIFRCGFEWVGVSDIGLMFTSFRSDMSNDVKDFDLTYLIGDPDKDAAMLKQASPVENAARITQPVLIAAGALDPRVPIVHFTALKSALGGNKNVLAITYPDEGHGWYYDKNNYDFWTQVEKFLAANMGAQ